MTPNILCFQMFIVYRDRQTKSPEVNSNSKWTQETDLDIVPIKIWINSRLNFSVGRGKLIRILEGLRLDNLIRRLLQFLFCLHGNSQCSWTTGVADCLEED